MICAPKTWADLIHACSLAWFKRYSRWRHKKIWRIFLHESFHETWKALNICTQSTSINQTIEIEYKQLIQVVRGRAGAQVSEGKIINQRKNLPIECAQGDQPPNRVFCVKEPSAVPWWRCTVVRWPVLIHEVGCRVRWKNVVGCEVTWGEVMWLVARCHFMSCNVTWCQIMPCHLTWCNSLCCVVSRDAMRCHMMSCHVMSCHLLWSDAKIGWNLMSLWWDVAGCEVTLSGWKCLNDVVNWKMMWWSVLQY